MDDIENVVRRIVAQADINVITKRLVRTEYRKLTGADALSEVEKKTINAALDKIIAEIAQKMQPEHTNNTAIDNKTLLEENTNTDNVITRSLVGQTQSLVGQTQSLVGQKEEMRTQGVSKQLSYTTKSKEVHGADKVTSDFPVKVVSSFKHKTPEKSFVLIHPLCKNQTLEARKLCMECRPSKCKRMTSSEALMWVLDSNDVSLDESGCELVESPQKKTTAGDGLLKGANVKGSQASSGKSEQQNAKTCDILNTESSDLDITVTPAKKYKTQDFDLSNARVVNNDRSLLTNSSPNSASERNVNNVYRELYSKSGISYTPESTCSKSSSLDFLKMNSQKCRQDCVIDTSLDNEIHLADVNSKKHLDNLTDEEKMKGNLKCKKKAYVIGSSSDSESDHVSCLSVAKKRQRYRADDSVQKQATVRVLLSKADSSSVEPATDALFGGEISADHGGSDQDRDRCMRITQSESSPNHESASNDSFTSCSITRRARLKIRARKRIFDDSDSEFQLSGSPQKNMLYKPKRNGKNATVMIKTVDKCCSDIEVIKYGVVSDSEILESIENEAERIQKGRKSFSESKHFKSKKQTLKTQKSKRFHVNDCNSDISHENVTCSQCMKHSQDFNQTSKPTKSSVYDLSDDDEYDVPLSSLKSYRNSSSRRSDSVKNRGCKTNKCCVVVSTKEKEISDDVRNHRHSDSRYHLGPKVQVYLFNSVSSNRWSSPQRIPLMRAAVDLTGCRMNDSTCGSTSSRTSYCSDNDEHVSASRVCIPHSSDSDDSLSSLLSHISPDSSLQSKTIHSTTEEVCENAELSKLKSICRTVGIILRNTKELAGCSTNDDKIKRIKQLLEGRGMRGKPTLEKAKKMKLLKEMKELESDKIVINSQKEGRRKCKMSAGSFWNTDSSRERQTSTHTNSHVVFSDLKDVITIDDSDS